MLEQNITAYLANLLKLKTSQINAAIKLIDEGNTIPFIARYRKEATGDMKDEQLRDLNDKLIYVRNLIKRQNEIKNSIEEQGKMTPELSLAIDKVEKLQELEDIYLPYKQKKRTRAMIAKEKGLEPLAQFILKQEDSSEKLEDIALKYLMMRYLLVMKHSLALLTSLPKLFLIVRIFVLNFANTSGKLLH